MTVGRPLLGAVWDLAAVRPLSIALGRPGASIARRVRRVAGAQHPSVVVMKLGALVVPHLPATMLEPLAAILGATAYVVARPARRGLARNLVPVLGGDDADLVALRAREAFRTQAANYLDLFRIPALTLEQIAALVELRGGEHITAALAAGRGAILATVHLGNVDLVAQVARARGFPVTIPVEPLRPSALFALVSRLRSAHGIRLVPIDGAAFGEVGAVLRRGEVVGLVVDRDAAGSSESLPFFGRSARLSIAPVLLALRYGAPILPVRCQRLSGGRYLAEVGAPIDRASAGSTRARARAMALELLAALEGAIRQAPGQWVMFVPVFQEGAA